MCGGRSGGSGNSSRKGADLLAGGEMGIGNTTAAAVLTAFFTGRITEHSTETVTGRGTGVDDAGSSA